MRAIGLPELMAIFGGVAAVVFYGLIFFVLWKFYQMFSRINENLAGIKDALNRNGPRA